MDELIYLEEGRRLVDTFEWKRIDTVKHPPLSYYLNGYISKLSVFSDRESNLFWTRMGMVPFGMLLAGFVFLWSRRLWGDTGGLVSLGLFALSPNMIAHCRLITGDILLACFWTMAIYFHWRLLERGGAVNVAFATASLGLALLSKHTSAMLLFIIPILTLVSHVMSRHHDGAQAGRRVWLSTLGVIVGALLIVNAGYGFAGTCRSPRSFDFHSTSMKTISRLPVLGALPAPFPAPYLVGLDRQQYVSESGHPAYLLGKRSVHGWWYYFIVVALFKVPLPILIAPLLSVALWRQGRGSTPLSLAALLVPAGVLLLHASFFNNNCNGLRYMLPVFPVAFVIAGRLATVRFARGKLAVGTAVAVWLVVSAISTWPDHLSYTNVLVRGKENAYRYVSGVDLGWGENWLAATQWQESNPDAVVDPGRLAMPGRLILSANDANDHFRVQQIHQWLEPFRPVQTIGGEWLIFELHLSDLEQRAKESDRASAELDLAAAYFHAERYTEAEDAIQRALTRGCETQIAHHLLGLIHFAQRDLVAAEKEFTTAGRGLDYPEAFFDLSVLKAYAGDSEGAEYFYGRALAIEAATGCLVPLKGDIPEPAQPESLDDARLLNNMAVESWKKGDLKSAERLLRKAVSFDKDYIDPIQWLSAMLVSRESYKPAFALASEAERVLEHVGVMVHWGGRAMVLTSDYVCSRQPRARIIAMEQARIEGKDDKNVDLMLAYFENGDHTHQILRSMPGLSGTGTKAAVAHASLALAFAKMRLLPLAEHHAKEAVKKDTSFQAGHTVLKKLETYREHIARWQLRPKE